MTSKPDQNIHNLRLERALLQETSPKAREATLEALQNAPNGTGRLEALKASTRQIHAEHNPETVAGEIALRLHKARVLQENQQEKTRKERLRWILGAAPVLAAAALLFVLFPGGEVIHTQAPYGGPDEVIRTKGGPTLFLYQRADGEIQAMPPENAQAKPGESIQVTYQAAGRHHGVVFSIDGNSVVTLHYPSDPRGNTALEQGEITLPNSYELDDAPAFERFFFVTSAHPLDTPAILRAGRALAEDAEAAQNAPLDLPEGLEQSDFLLKKVAP